MFLQKGTFLINIYILHNILTNLLINRYVIVYIIFNCNFFLETTLINDKNADLRSKQFNIEQKYDKKNWYLKIALKVFVKELQLDNEDILQGKIEIRKIPTNTYVMREDSHKVFYFC